MRPRRESGESESASNRNRKHTTTQRGWRRGEEKRGEEKQRQEGKEETRNREERER